MYDSILEEIEKKRIIYVEMVLITFTERIGDDNFIYQHDNGPVYMPKRTKRWLHGKEYQGFNMASLFPRFEFHRKSLGNNCRKISCPLQAI